MQNSRPHQGRVAPAIPLRAGVGLKAEHYKTILETRPDVGFFEIIAENFMGAGGPPHRSLEEIRHEYPISLHGVGLSIGGYEPLDHEHLERLRALERRYEPGLVSEHLAWSSHDTIYYSDLLPVPYDEETLARVVDHIDEVQQTLGRRMLLENPSTYVAFSTSTMSELDFLKEVSRRTGCGLLLDVNNVYVSAVNHGQDPQAYIDAFPMDAVGEIHLGGHAPDTDENGGQLLIDAHDREVAEMVWALFERAVARAGAVPTLIEWDNDVPAWPVLAREAARADAVLASLGSMRRAAAS